MDAAIQQKIDTWLSGNFDEDIKTKVKDLQSSNPEDLADAFYRNLEFGTGGLRGIMGVGTNRMNKYTVGMATQGYANYLKQCFGSSSADSRRPQPMASDEASADKDVKVAIAYDSRNNSRFFAETAAKVFAANGIKVFLFEDMRPTPELSFAIRTLKCQGGVVCTASHNPKEYNGYKAYWNDGSQLVPPHDKNVINEVDKIASVDDVKWSGGDENLPTGQAGITLIGKD